MHLSSSLPDASELQPAHRIRTIDEIGKPGIEALTL
jgi:hypothetical protein